jgi:NADP-dependent 3-hydroxy acid dehydrogenase YdfG
MEPTVLLIGRNLDTLEILKDELDKFDRNIVYANSEELIESNLKNKKIDLIVVGAGLPNETI